MFGIPSKRDVDYLNAEVIKMQEDIYNLEAHNRMLLHYLGIEVVRHPA